MKKVFDAIKLAVAKQNHLSKYSKDLDLFYYGKIVSFLRGLLGLAIILFFLTSGARLMNEFVIDMFNNWDSIEHDTPVVVNEELNTVTMTFYRSQIEDLQEIDESSDIMGQILSILFVSIVLILLVSLIVFVVRVWIHKREVDSLVSELDHPKFINSWDVEYILVDSAKYEIKGMDDEGVLICEAIEEVVHE